MRHLLVQRAEPVPRVRRVAAAPLPDVPGELVQKMEILLESR